MKHRSIWKEKWITSWMHSDESLPLQPILELCGERRVLIENHGGVIQYGTEQICVAVRYGQVQINGAGLRLCRMQGPQLVIMGKIECITLIRRKA